MNLNQHGFPIATNLQEMMQHLQDPAIRQAAVHKLALMGPPPEINAGNPQAMERGPMQAMRYSRIFTNPEMPK